MQMIEQKQEDHVLSILQRLDVFGIGINIKFNEKEKHNTKIGGCFTIIMFILMLIFSLNLFSDIIFRRNPSVVFEQNSIISPKRFNLHPDNFAIAFALIGEDFHPFIDESVYTIVGEIFYKNKIYDSVKMQNIEDSGTIEIEMSICNENHFQDPESRDYFLKLEYKKMYCIKNMSQLYIEGQFDADRFTMIKVNVKECMNSDKIKCKDQEERKNILQNTKLQVYYMNRVIQISKYDKPFQKVGQTQFWRTNYNMVQQLNLMFVNTYVSDDANILYGENYYSKGDLVFSSERLLQGSRDIEKGENFYEIEIFMDKNKENYYKRIYLKLPQAISQIGGIFNVFFALGCFFSHPYARMSLQRKLINQTFSFDNEDTDKKQNTSVLQKQKEKNNLHLNIHDQSFRERKASNSPSRISQNILASYQQSILGHANTSSITHNNNNHSQKHFQFANKRQQKSKKIESLINILQDETQQKQQQKNILTIFKDYQKQNNDKIKIQNIENEQKKKQKINKQETTDINISVIDNKSHNQCENNMNHEQQSQTINKTFEDNNEESQIMKIFKQVKIGTIDYFKSYFSYFNWFKDSKSELLNYCIKKIYCYTDICFFVNKLIEFEKLKHLILDLDQVSLFECIPKPRVGSFLIEEKTPGSVQSQELMNIEENIRNQYSGYSIINILSLQNRSLTEKIIQAQIALRKIQRKKQKKSQIDQKLIHMLDLNLIKLLGQNNFMKDQYSRFEELSNMKQSERFQNSTFCNNQTEKNQSNNQLQQKQQIQLEKCLNGRINEIKIIKNKRIKKENEKQDQSDEITIESIFEQKEDIYQPQQVYINKEVSIIPHNSQNKNAVLQDQQILSHTHLKRDFEQQDEISSLKLIPNLTFEIQNKQYSD